MENKLKKCFLKLIFIFFSPNIILVVIFYIKQMPEDKTSNNTQTIIEDKVKRPSMYEVILLNDDYTPMEFVVDVLIRYFNKDIEQANQIMMHVHRNGKGLCGIYPFDIAETKVMQVMNYSIKNGHPLQCKMEKNK